MIMNDEEYEKAMKTADEIIKKMNLKVREEGKVMFKCSFCGKEYINALNRATCEIECDKVNKAKAEAEKQEKLKAEQDKRKNELEKSYYIYVETCNNARKEYMEVYNQYVKDYGYQIIHLSSDDFYNSLSTIMFRL